MGRFTAAVKTVRVSAAPPPQKLASFQSKGNKIAIGCSIRSEEKPMTSIAISKSLRSRGWCNIPLRRTLHPVGMKVGTFFFVWQVRLGTLHRARRSEPKWLLCFIINLRQVAAKVPARAPSYLSTPPPPDGWRALPGIIPSGSLLPGVVIPRESRLRAASRAPRQPGSNNKSAVHGRARTSS